MRCQIHKRKNPLVKSFRQRHNRSHNLSRLFLGTKQTLGKGDEVLVSLMEHHSNIVPWEITSKIKGFTIKYAKVNDDGTLDYADFESKITNKTKICCLSHVSNVTGVINDVKRIRQNRP
jgi:selenocysteine lyase/cysteine desulfurase